MGGCHCSYRNCPVRSDGVTHMFHYPVFDKVRCHQWLVNTGRLEFLNLKVSQLKNRVICQHHFKDDDFMNYKKEKLKFNAVPKLDGPFCEPKTMEDIIAQEGGNTYDISLDDIENEILSINEKKANFSVKYGDFLVNGYPMPDPLYLNNKPKKDFKKRNFIPDVFFEMEPAKVEKNLHIDSATDMFHLNSGPQIDKQTNSNNCQNEHKTDIPMALPDNKQIPIETVKIQAENCLIQNNNKMDISMNPPLTKQNIDKNKKICIVFEETLSDKSFLSKEPIVLGKLEPVQPSLILPLPSRRKLKKTNDSICTNDVSNVNQNVAPKYKEEINKSDTVEKKYQIVNDMELKYEVPIMSIVGATNEPLQLTERMNKMDIDTAPTINVVETKISNTAPTTNIVETKISKKHRYNNQKTSNPVIANNPIKDTSQSVPHIKGKLAPERVAVIEKKRKFNMKLRDIVESCLDKIDIKEKDESTQNVDSDLKIKQTESPKDDSFASLEARLKKMEQNLLGKIEQNAEKILNLKNSVLPETKKRTTSTQTSSNEETHKKYLYQEISKFLSPEANSLLYEELFINKYAQKVPKPSTTPKRRKCR